MGKRFILFCRAALDAARSLGWFSGCHPIVMTGKNRYSSETGMHHGFIVMIHSLPVPLPVYTIHNLAYQGIFGLSHSRGGGCCSRRWFPLPTNRGTRQCRRYHGARHPLRGCCKQPSAKRYAQEILTPTYGEKLDQLLRSRRERLFWHPQWHRLLGNESHHGSLYCCAVFDADTLDRRAEK